jgi:hypothetical protein
MSEADADRWFALLREGMRKREAATAIGLGIWVFRHREDTDVDFRRATRDAVAIGERERQRMARDASRATAHVDADLQSKVDVALRGLVTYSDAARTLGVSREAVRQMARKGVLPRVETPAGPLVAVGR